MAPRKPEPRPEGRNEGERRALEMLRGARIAEASIDPTGALMLLLANGWTLFAMRDPEGNGPGAAHLMPPPEGRSTREMLEATLIAGGE